jgi:hypothetical protein
VPAHVLAHCEHVARAGEQPGRVQPAGPLEHSLRTAKRVGQPCQHAGGHLKQVLIEPEPAGNAQFGDAGFATDAAGAAGQEVAPGASRQVRAQGHVGYVAHRVVGLVVVTALAAVADPDRCDVGGCADDAFAEQEAGCQVNVVAGRPHGQADGLAADPDAEWLLCRQQVGSLADSAVVDADPGDSPARRPSGHGSSDLVGCNGFTAATHTPACSSQAMSVEMGP